MLNTIALCFKAQHQATAALCWAMLHHIPLTLWEPNECENENIPVGYTTVIDEDEFFNHYFGENYASQY